MDKLSYNLARKDRVVVLKMLMNSPVGRKWLWGVLANCKIFSSTIGEHYEMCFLEGKRTIGLDIYKDIQSDGALQKQYLKMQQEYIESMETKRGK